MQGKKSFEEKLFTNFQLSDRVPTDNFYRRLKENLNLEFVRKLTLKYYGTEGQVSIDPIVFFKLMLVGYLENLASDRRIIATALIKANASMDSIAQKEVMTQCLPTIINGLKQNLLNEGLIVEQIIADTGYSSGEAIKAAEKNNITAYIPNFGKYKPEREGFIYHKAPDYYECPQGKHILFKKIKNNNGHLAKEYRSSRKDGSGCHLRETCIGKSPEKKIVDTIDKPYYDKMHLRLQGTYAKAMKKLRQSTVEPVLGTLINFLGMRRINTRGIKLANKCMIMAAVAYNIKKMMRFAKPKPTARAMQLNNALNQHNLLNFYSYSN